VTPTLDGWHRNHPTGDALHFGGRMTLPITCELTPEAIRARREGLLPGLAARAIGREETDDGYRLSFSTDGEILQLIAKVIDAERQCCRWLSFSLTVAPENGPIALTLSGPEGAREFLAALLDTR
jgi:hypothetical protein